jgi:hypothetical protein
MIGVLKQVLVGIAVCLVVSATVGATVSVSPVVIEAVQVEAGQVFDILCHNWGDEVIAMDLSLALFDQDESGGVVLLEDASAIERAQGFLNIAMETIFLEPDEEGVIQVELLGDEFDHLYGVLLIEPRQGGIQTRFAVLFLLSTAGSEVEANMAVSCWAKEEEALTFTVQNNGLRHGPWEGELHFFDASDQLSEKRQITSGLILAGRSRGVQVSLPYWVQRVEILSAYSEQAR